MKTNEQINHVEFPFITEEHRMIREQLRRFIKEKVLPFGDRWEQDEKVPREALRELGAMGILGMCHPTEYGGSGLGSLATVILGEELGQCTFGGFTISVLVHTDMASPYLRKFGNDAQKKKYMEKIIKGEVITAIGVTESEAGSDVKGLQTRAVRDGNDYILNGSKMFITNGVYGDLVFVAARTDMQAKPTRGISMFLLETGTPGFSTGRKLKKHGWWCSDTAELVFDDCRIPKENLLGEENQGFYYIMQGFQNERLAIGGMCIGEAQKAIQLALNAVRTRKAFGGTLWEQQTIRQRLAMLAAEVESLRNFVYNTAWQIEQGKDCVKEVSMIKAYGAELLQRVMYTSLQFHGGMGYIRETAIERMTRDARVSTIGGGATEVMLEEIAKRI